MQIQGGTPCLLGVSSMLWAAAGRGDSAWRVTASDPQEPGCGGGGQLPPSAECSRPADDRAGRTAGAGSALTKQVSKSQALGPSKHDHGAPFRSHCPAWIHAGRGAETGGAGEGPCLLPPPGGLQPSHPWGQQRLRVSEQRVSKGGPAPRGGRGSPRGRACKGTRQVDGQGWQRAGAPGPEADRSWRP